MGTALFIFVKYKIKLTKVISVKSVEMADLTTRWLIGKKKWFTEKIIYSVYRGYHKDVC